MASSNVTDGISAEGHIVYAVIGILGMLIIGVLFGEPTPVVQS